MDFCLAIRFPSGNSVARHSGEVYSGSEDANCQICVHSGGGFDQSYGTKRGSGKLRPGEQNVAITGNSVCGPMNNALCVENLGGSFVWDNTAQSTVPGTVGVTSISGPINFATLSVSGLLTSVSPPQNSIQATFSDPGGDFAAFAINFLGPDLPLGTYSSSLTSQAPGTFNQIAGQCMTALCNATLSNSDFSGTVTVTPTPEPSPVLLLGTGLIGLAAFTWRRWRLA